ncbi:MAG: putative toxin-antitoxin system toxin component, PIN family [Desulfovibrio sp.]|nr:putative toxin-antitoxin system toxin component, PIN family [Desulfovibrio sp.]
MVPRVVLDTNCLISALIFRQGKTAALRQLWQAGELKPLVCRETVTELIRVLSYPKFRLSRGEAEILLAEFLPWTESVALSAPCTAIPELRDPDDAVFLNLARSAGADHLISGDRHLREMRAACPDPSILSPAEFLLQRANRPQPRP